MKKYYLYIAILALCAPLCAYPAISLAQSSSDEEAAEGQAMQEMQYDEAMAARETAGYMEGEVVGVNAAQEVVVAKNSQYDNEPYAYYANRSTTFINVDSLEDIGKGDYVNIDYFVSGDKRIAESINVEEKAYKKEETAKVTLEKVLSD